MNYVAFMMAIASGLCFIKSGMLPTTYEEHANTLWWAGVFIVLAVIHGAVHEARRG